MNYTSSRIDVLYSKTLPALANHVDQIANALTNFALDNDVHDRKWSLVVNGMDGPSGESQSQTRTQCVTFATSISVSMHGPGLRASPIRTPL